MQLTSAVAVALAVVTCLVLFQIVRARWQQQSKLANLTLKCADLPVLHVLLEAEFGLVQDSVDCICRLMDNASCPTQLSVHVLEPVTSIKALDILNPELERACKLAPNFSTFFKEQTHVHKVHRTRNITGPSALAFLLEHLSRTVKRQDLVLWIPNTARLSKGWDDGLRADVAEARKRGGHLVVSPLMPMPAAHRDIDRFFFSESAPTPAFFALREELTFEALPMSRPGVTPAIGVSMRHPVCGSAEVMSQLASFDTDMDLVLSFATFAAQLSVFHGSKALGFRSHVGSVPNRKLHLQALSEMKEKFDESVFDQWMFHSALGKTETGDLQVFGRALMGMTLESALPEILVKWGSEAAFETEKEALRYG